MFTSTLCYTAIFAETCWVLVLYKCKRLSDQFGRLRSTVLMELYYTVQIVNMGTCSKNVLLS
jgi:hypothetical protein